MSADSAHILVVDDNPATRYSTSRILRGAGWQVSEAATGEEGYEKALQGIDLLVLDVNLPDVDGFTICRRLREREFTARLPILHLSATFVTAESKVHGLEAGADGYLTHPVEPPVLIATVHAFLRTRNAEIESRRSEARFKSVFENTLNGVAVLDEKLCFVDVNPALSTTLRLSRDKMLNRCLPEFVPEHWQAEVEAILKHLDKNSAWHGEFPLERTDGELVYFDWNFSQYTVPGLRLATASNITLRVRFEEEREALLISERAARADAEEANRLKDDFLATLSHELRTPLSAIVGWSSVLRVGHPSPAELEEGLEAIERNALAQSQLIGDLLDISRITTGKIRLDLQLLEPTTLMDAALVAVLPLATKKSIRVSKTFEPGTSPINGDPARLQQVFWNLINNAVKFTPEGGKIHLAVSQNGSNVEMRIADTGQGIAGDLLPLIFERFRQGDSSSTREHGGLGLGLAIVKQLVELHSGAVAAESSGVGLGTTFTVSIPAAARPRSSAMMDTIVPTDPATAKAADLSGVRVLFVEDDADSRMLIRRLLKDAGAEVLETERAAEALGALADFKPHVLLSDLGMPTMDGYALIREIRAQNGSFQQLPAIALTAFARAEDRRRCLLAGFQMHLSKPVSRKELIESIATVLGRIGA